MMNSFSKEFFAVAPGVDAYLPETLAIPCMGTIYEPQFDLLSVGTQIGVAAAKAQVGKAAGGVLGNGVPKGLTAAADQP